MLLCVSSHSSVSITCASNKRFSPDISANHRRLVKNEEMLEQRGRWLFHISGEGLNSAGEEQRGSANGKNANLGGEILHLASLMRDQGDQGRARL